MTDTAKRRRSSSPTEHDSTKRTTGSRRHEHGDTYISGSANVHIGDSFYLGDKEDCLQQEARRLQDSLSFPQMHERYESLSEAADGTYQWIFESGLDHTLVTRQRQMTPFFDWFRTGTGSFWISGKPGSGKSTLMKYLAEHIHAHVMENASQVLTVFSFFFWIGGTNLQRSRSGCMRSLLWQALQCSTTRDLAIEVCQSRFKAGWTERVLQNSLSAFLDKLNSPLAIFLDGLDESGDHDDTLSFLEMLQSFRNIKICVSSRPEMTLIDSLSTYPSLKLQTLTSNDIRNVIRCTFEENPRVLALSAESGSDAQEDLHDLGWEIQLKAEGVFLWVILVIKDLLRGIKQKDDVSTLRIRLERLPNDLSALYEDLLYRAQPDYDLYKSQAALYLSLALHRDFSLIEFCFAINEDLRKEYLHPSVFDRDIRSEMVIDCRTVMAQISTRTAGLLEVRRTFHDDSGWREGTEHPRSERALQIMKVSEKFGDHVVRLIHRTAYAFLKDTTHGQSLLEVVSISGADIEQLCFETKLIRRTVLLSLLGIGLPSNWTHNVFGCTACREEAICNFLSNQGQNVLHSLLAAGQLVPDTCDWVVSHRADPLFAVRTWSCPSSKYATIDLLPGLIRAGRYTLARTWLDRYKCIGDSPYLTMLLVGVLNSMNGQPYIKAGLLDLVQALEDGGADLRQSMSIQTGEIYRPFGAAHVGAYHLRVQSRELTHLLDWEPYDQFSRFWPSCAGCHQVWCSVYGHPVYYFEFWGHFCAGRDWQRWGLERMDVSMETSLYSDDHFGKDRIFVLASRHGTSSTERLPQLCAISEKDSQVLESTMVQYNEYHIPIALGVRCFVHYTFEDRLDKKVSQSALTTIQARSPALTFAAAMKRLDKSQEMIQKFYEYEAKRMWHKSEDERARWRHWFWGDEAPVPLEDNTT